MGNNALATFIARVRAAWGPLTSELAATCSEAMASLAEASVNEPWLAALLREQPVSADLHRDPNQAFVLLAHTERAGLYRPPHDHGRSWVVYAVQHGEVEMGTYARIEDQDGGVRLVKRNTTVVRAGEVQVYLPGDIHDTCCRSETALLFRFTERDLKRDDAVVRYPDPRRILVLDGV